jgi:hypothetical protein
MKLPAIAVSCAGPLLFAVVAAGQTLPAAVEPPPFTAVEPPPQPAPMFGRWRAAVFGAIELDAMRDSTQSFSDIPNNNPLLRSDGSLPAYLPLGTMLPAGPTYGSTHPRFQSTARNTRFGVRVSPPEFGGVQATGVLDLDFIGNQPGAPPQTSEASFFTSPTPRMRQGYLKLETERFEVLLGQSYGLFGWQPLFFPGTDSFLGIPNELFGRTPQLRVMATLRSSPVNLQIAVAALRPPQRDGGLPDLQAGVRLVVNDWRGAHGAGSAQASVDSASIGVSGVVRRFRVAAFSNNAGDPTTATEVAEASGYGVSLDGLIPLIPAKSVADKSNALTLTGSFVNGAGIADLFTGGLTGGVHFPLPEGPGGPNTGTYVSNIDPGIVQYTLVDTPDGQQGVLRLIKWQAYIAGLQYFLPPAGRFVLTANYSTSKSSNIAQPVDQGGDPSRTFWKAVYYDANLFADVTPAIRLALSYQHIGQTFVASNGKEKNDRFELSGILFF